MITTGLKKSKFILDYLDEILSDAKCELNYTKDYELLIAVMLSAQTTDKRVNEVTKVLFKKYPTLKDLEKADVKSIQKIIYPLGTYKIKSLNVKKIAQQLVKIGGIVPNDRGFLESLSGVGRKTTNVVLSILYDEPCIAVDTHVARVSKRLKIAKNSDNVQVIERKLMKMIPKDKVTKVHHQLVLFGRYFCKAKNPMCDTCKLKSICKK